MGAEGRMGDEAWRLLRRDVYNYIGARTSRRRQQKWPEMQGRRGEEWIKLAGRATRG